MCQRNIDNNLETVERAGVRHVTTFSRLPRDNRTLIRSGEARLVGWSRQMLYSGFNILPRSVIRSADINGRSDNLDVIPLKAVHCPFDIDLTSDFCDLSMSVRDFVGVLHETRCVQNLFAHCIDCLFNNFRVRHLYGE